MNVQHTPGPWNDGMDANGNILIFQRRADPYLTIEDVNDEWQANLRLVDAAPDLLESLRGLCAAMACYESTPEETLALEYARAAIAKAAGEAA